MRRTIAMALVSAAVMLALPAGARACPACQDMNTSPGTDAEAAARLAGAYNRSIYLMLPIPYLLLGGIGLAYYRGYRKAYEQARQQHDPLG